MCRHHKARRHERSFEHEPASATHPYEGATTRLEQGVVQPRRSCGGGFPWWTLWLIWPAAALIKHATVPALLLLQTAWNPALAVQALGAMALIILGLALVRRT